MSSTPVERVPARKVSLLVDSRCFTRIYDDYSFLMLNRPGVPRRIYYLFYTLETLAGTLTQLTSQADEIVRQQAGPEPTRR